MQSIQSHTHKEREKVLQKLVPIIQKQLGDNLIALAVGGSFARDADIDYSDIELVAFTRKSLDNDWEIRKIEDGMLIVVVADTKENYIKKYLDISDIWYASGAEKLSPIINAELINEINSFKPENIEAKCMKQIDKNWFNFQEITAKALNMIRENNREGFSLVFPQMIKELVIILAYLNQTPFVTLGSYISQAKNFKIKPHGFDQLIHIAINGQYKNFSVIEEKIKEVFTDLELLLQEKD